MDAGKRPAPGLRLLDLSPRWLFDDGVDRWLLFRSPAGHGDWLTCKNFVMTQRDQREYISRLAPDLDRQPIVTCNPAMCWKMTGTLDNLTCMPSIDASASGNWHGYIKNGKIE